MNYQNRLRGCVFLACGFMTLSVVALGASQTKSEEPILYESSVQYDAYNLPGDDIEAEYPTIIAYYVGVVLGNMKNWQKVLDN